MMLGTYRFRIVASILGACIILACFFWRISSPSSTVRETNPASVESAPAPIPQTTETKRADSATGDVRGVPAALEPAKIWESLLAKHLADRGQLAGHSQYYSQFGREKILHLTEARLLALAYPELVAPLATQVALDPNRDQGARNFAIRILGYMAKENLRDAQSELVRLAKDNDSVIRESAIYALYPSDSNGAYRNIYSEECNSGTRTAFRAISFWPDSSAIDMMRRLRERDDGPIQGEMRLMAEDTIKKFDTLLSPDWESKIEATLLSDRQEQRLEWALGVATTRGLPTLEGTIRKRLDQDMEAAKRVYAFRTDAEREVGVTGQPTFEATYVATMRANAIPDFSYDSLLLTLSSIKGKLTDLEKARLHYFGYACDPKQRLEELLSTGK